MTAQLISAHRESWLLPGSPSDPRLLHADPSDCVLVYPPHLGQGYRQNILLGDDLRLTILDYTLRQDVIADAPDEGTCLKFEFCLAGHRAGYNFLVPRFGSKQFGVTPAQQQIFEIEIVFKQPALVNYFQTFVEHLSPQTQKIVERVIQSVHRYQGGSLSTRDNIINQIASLTTGSISTAKPHVALEQLLSDDLYSEAVALNYAARSSSTAAIEQVIQQILSCPYQGLTRRTYLEQKALELVHHRLEAMVQPHTSVTDFDYIYEAAAVLRNQLVNPPTVETLARQVCTNRFKLHQGFHQVYGTTPFGYLRDCRLMQARKLLMTSTLSVEAIAAKVGYASRSHFAIAFRKQMGINPKAFQMQAWQCAS